MSTADTPVQRFSYKKAMNCFSEVEKARMLCVALTVLDRVKPTGEDMKLAAAQYGGAEGGFIRSYANHVKKLKDQNCYIIDGEDLDTIPTPPATPAKGAAPKKAPTKRKASETPTAEGEEAPETPAKKPRAAPKKKASGKKADSPMADVKDEDSKEGVRNKETTPDEIVQSIEKA